MDTDASAGRFFAFTTANSTTLQTSGDPPGPQYRRSSSGSDSGSSNDGRVVQHPQRAEQFQPAIDPQRATFGAENPPFNAAQRLENVSATIYVDDSPYMPPDSSHSSQSTQFVQDQPNAQYQTAFFDYHARMSAPVTPTVLQPAPRRRNSGGSSPTDSVRSQGSDQSGNLSTRSPRSASSGTSTHEGRYSNQNVQMGESYQAQSTAGAPTLDFQDRYPAYDGTRRIGLDHVRFDTIPPQGTGQSYYRPRTMTYPNLDDGPHVMSMSLNSPDSSEMSTFSRRDPAPIPLPPSTPQHDFPPRTIPLGENTTGLALPSNSHSTQPMSHLFLSTSHSLSSDLPDPTPNLRQLLGLGPDEEVSLYALADPPPGEKPNYPYPTLIKLAIHGSPKKRLTLQEIYAALEERFQWFRDNAHDKAWQNSIRHNLSLNKCFRRVSKPITEPGKGSYWVVDYSQGEGNKRARKRNKRPTKAELARRAQEAAALGSRQEESNSSDEDQSVSTPSQASRSGTSQTPSISIAQLQETHIDPELRNQGHIVGQGRVRTDTGSAVRSSTRRANSPYTQASPSQGQSQSRSAPPSASPIPVPQMLSQASMSAPERASRSTAAFGQVAFGQPAFGQSSLGNWQPSFAQLSPPAARLPQSPWASAMPALAPQPSGQPLAFMPHMSSPMHLGSSEVQHARSAMPSTSNQVRDIRNVLVLQPPPRPGVQHVRDPSSGLVVARRVGMDVSAPGQGNMQQYNQGMSTGGTAPADRGRPGSSSSSSSPD
ncbi:hypothetical protein AcV5_008692 [Taiwanofungus camphoratus]|nr:hypothetical protein AcV5_008692 [Antrodia cinnamomea]KAI0956238.1 hypothetical protein AcV7_006688 [Antrodia cinnamomea]